MDPGTDVLRGPQRPGCVGRPLRRGTRPRSPPKGAPSSLRVSGRQARTGPVVFVRRVCTRPLCAEYNVCTTSVFLLSLFLSVEASRTAIAYADRSMPLPVDGQGTCRHVNRRALAPSRWVPCQVCIPRERGPRTVRRPFTLREGERANSTAAGTRAGHQYRFVPTTERDRPGEPLISLRCRFHRDVGYTERPTTAVSPFKAEPEHLSLLFEHRHRGGLPLVVGPNQHWPSAPRRSGRPLRPAPRPAGCASTTPGPFCLESRPTRSGRPSRALCAPCPYSVVPPFRADRVGTILHLESGPHPTAPVRLGHPRQKARVIRCGPFSAGTRGQRAPTVCPAHPSASHPRALDAQRQCTDEPRLKLIHSEESGRNGA